MPNYPIEVPLPANVKQYLAQPHCANIQIPPPQKASLCLPFGGQVKGIVDATKAIPDDCSLTFSLMLQLPPIMAPLACFIKVLKLIQPLIDIIKAIAPAPDPIKIGQALPDFLKAAGDVVGCLVAVQAGVPMFVRDLLLLIAKFLVCVSQQIKSVAALLGNLQLSITAAQQNSNKVLAAQLECARQSAVNQAQGMMQQMDAIAAILELAQPFLGMVGAPSITLPSAVPPDDLQELLTISDTMLQIGQVMQTFAQGLPTC